MVRLKAAYGEFYAVAGMTFSWSNISAKVKNIAYSKTVQLHYRSLTDGLWKDKTLPFMNHFENYDIFGSPSAPFCQEFVIKYIVDGSVCWDNNNGLNYQIGTYAGTVGGNVMLKKATARIGMEAGGGFTFTTSWIEGEIYVRHLTYHKKVGIRYSADGGVTWQDSDGSYLKQEHGVAADISGMEIWSFKTPTYNYNPASDSFRFAVYYEMRDPGPGYGQQFWDNNFSQDYTLSKVNDSTLE
ncbi:MAG: hypothetical protein WC291_04290 [Thermodesulfovibrionales bacterium]|jgi:hypothetical protein